MKVKQINLRYGWTSCCRVACISARNLSISYCVR